MALGAAVGNLLDRTGLGMVVGLGLGLVAGLLIDDPRGPEDGTISRALVWLVGGMAMLFLLALAIAPELLEAPGQITATLGVVLVAGVPGALLLLGLVARRRRIDRHDVEQE